LDSGQKIRNGYELEKTSPPKVEESPKQRKVEKETKNDVQSGGLAEPVAAKEDDTVKYVILVAVVLTLAGVYFVYLK
jgi:hypothetical protein